MGSANFWASTRAPRQPLFGIQAAGALLSLLSGPSKRRGLWSGGSLHGMPLSEGSLTMQRCARLIISRVASLRGGSSRISYSTCSESQQ